MHYANGREAKNGDKVIWKTWDGSLIIGYLHDAVAGNDYCNGKIAIQTVNDPCPNLREVLHYDDFKELAKLDEVFPKQS